MNGVCENPEWKALCSSKALTEGQWCQVSLGAGQWSDHVEPHSHVNNLFFILRAARNYGRVFRRALGIMRFEYCKAHFGCAVEKDNQWVEVDGELRRILQ